MHLKDLANTIHVYKFNLRTKVSVKLFEIFERCVLEVSKSLKVQPEYGANGSHSNN